MSNYNSENTHILATHMEGGDNRRMLLMHICGNGRHEFVIGSYFHEKRYSGALGYERWDYEWDWGHYFSDIVDAVEYWSTEVLGNEGCANIEVMRPDKFDGSVPMDKETVERMWRDFGDGACDCWGNLYEPFCGWPRGTNREDVWHWFDWQYREYGGVSALMYGDE